MKLFKVWVDDVRLAPDDYNIWCKSVKEAITAIRWYDRHVWDIDGILIDLDHDAGNFVKDGGDYIKILDWLEQSKLVDTGYFFKLHTMNPVGRDNMRRIIEHNGWREVQ